MTESRRRALRTLIQAALGAIGAGAINLVADVLGVDLDERVLAIIGVSLTAFLTQMQIDMEDRRGGPIGIDPTPPE